MWINRQLRDRLQNSVNSRPAVLLTGARQTGKSSLLQKHFPATTYVTFDHPRQVDAAKDSPEYFLSRFEAPVILDEIQYVPELLRYLKILIDQHRNHYGKWIMTGSQQFTLMEHISESLAGRIDLLHLETLSAYELREKGIKDISKYLWKGGYPELWSNPELDVEDFFESYIRTYIERDLKNIINVKELNDFRRFFRVLATRVGQLLNFRSLSSDVGVSDFTIRKWIHALEVGGLLYLLPPYYANIGKRLTKSPKIYFADHGLLCYLLGINNENDWQAHPYRGNMWENLVLMELIKTKNFTPGNNLFFYRDQNGVEVDFLLEQQGKLILIEAKANEKINAKRLNFQKVAALFEKKYQTAKILAQNIKEDQIIKYKDYDCFNPLFTTVFLS